jgi:hypothetical protein
MTPAFAIISAGEIAAFGFNGDGVRGARSLHATGRAFMPRPFMERYASPDSFSAYASETGMNLMNVLFTEYSGMLEPALRTLFPLVKTPTPRGIPSEGASANAEMTSISGLGSRTNSSLVFSSPRCKRGELPERHRERVR